jgi:hypothetical protein
MVQRSLPLALKAVIPIMFAKCQLSTPKGFFVRALNTILGLFIDLNNLDIDRDYRPPHNNIVKYVRQQGCPNTSGKYKYHEMLETTEAINVWHGRNHEVTFAMARILWASNPGAAGSSPAGPAIIIQEVICASLLFMP